MATPCLLTHICYITNMDYKVNNAKFVLLMLIKEQRGCNGYTLRQLVQERGYDAWSGVSSSSIYVTLKKLETKRLVISKIDEGKASKGPTGRIFQLSKSGEEVLICAIEDALRKSREHDPRYNIALCGIDFLPDKTVQDCFDQRQNFLSQHLEVLKEKAESDQLSLSAVLLFSRIINGIEAEIRWLEHAQEKLTSHVEH